MEHPSDYDTVKINYPVDLRLVADCVDSTASELQDLNPSLLRFTTPRVGSFQLHMPAGTKDQYETAIASIPPDMRLWWRYHTVHNGDTIMSIARTYHTTAKQIQEANHLDGTELEADADWSSRWLPASILHSTPRPMPGAFAVQGSQGRHRRIVADNFGVSAQMLRRWNGLHSDSIRGRKYWLSTFPIFPTSPDAEVVSSRAKTKRPKTETAVANRQRPSRPKSSA